jgi:hypothetical protein
MPRIRLHPFTLMRTSGRYSRGAKAFGTKRALPHSRYFRKCHISATHGRAKSSAESFSSLELELTRMRWTNLEVRKLLRLMRRPRALAQQRLAILLREALRAADERQALEKIIEEAFDSSSPTDRLRLDIIRRCDFAGQTTRQAATALHLSMRHFFRHRADAIDGITQAIERVLRRPPDSLGHLMRLARLVETVDPKAAFDIYRRAPKVHDGELAYNIVRTAVWAGLDVGQDLIEACEGPWRMLALSAVARHLVSCGENRRAALIRDELRAKLGEDLGPRYNAAAFELAFLDRCEACRRADARESEALLEPLRALAGDDESLLALAMISEADQALCDGDLTAAAIALDDVELLDVHGHDLNIMARTALARAMLSHVRGFHEEAFALANGAAPVIAALEGGFALRAAGIAGRAALMCGAQWAPPYALFERYPKVWTKALTEAVAARHLLALDPIASKSAAESALALAVHHESPVLISYAHVSLAGALDVLGDSDEAQRLRILAWETALRFRDQFALYDMFCHPFAPAHDIGCMIVDDSFVFALKSYLEEEMSGFESDATMLRAALGLTERFGGIVPLSDVAARTGRVAGSALAFLLMPRARQEFQERFARSCNVVHGIAPCEDQEARAV